MKTTTLAAGTGTGSPRGAGQQKSAPDQRPEIDRIEAALQGVARAITQVRHHEQILQAAGVRLDRAGATLLWKLSVHREPLRITALADLLDVDAPTVTRKIQQLERDGLVSRHADPDDKRATRIALTAAGRRTLERVLKARRKWLEKLLEGWGEDDLNSFATLLGKFADTLEREIHESHDTPESHEIGDGGGN
jgi:DNA-binding MarR family transcriptional regulator